MERAEMVKFKQFVEIYEETSVNEALNIQQRMKLKQSLRRNKAKIQLGRKRAARKMASAEVLKGRANKQAKNIIIKKILKNKQKGDLSYGSRVNLEKQVAKRKNAILRLAKKLLPQVRQKDRTKLQNKEK
jgi:thiamine kinase-like enzyme